MGQRKLTKRQLWRIKKIQEEKTLRANNKHTGVESNYAIDDEQSYFGQVIQNFGQSLLLQPLDKFLTQDDSDDSIENKIVRCTYRQNIGHLVAGDKVHWQKLKLKNQSSHSDYEGIIISLEERSTLLSRPDHLGNRKPIAANIDIAFIVTAPDLQSKNTLDKMINIRLVDRYLVICENNGIKPVIIINKMDLFDDNLIEGLQELLSIYAHLNYQIIYTSVINELGLSQLKTEMAGNKSIFVGQSGMGKSSLLNVLLPSAKAKIGEISASSGKGKHTTSSAILYDLNSVGIKKGFIIDSPGIRELGLWKLNKQDIHQGFTEINHYSQQCQFRDCQHENEPNCAVLDALDSGMISEERFISYQNIIMSLL